MKLDLQKVARAAGYWSIPILAIWMLCGFVNFTTGTHRGNEWYQKLNDKIFQFDKDLIGSPSAILLFITGPPIVMAMFSSLLVTSTPADPARLSWITKIFRMIPLFGSQGTNQFMAGDVNFNYLGFVLAMTGTSIFVIGYMTTFYLHKGMTTIMKLSGTSIFFGFGSLTCLSFFLIPVARHSAILAAMGWNPIHAMRIHIVSGYLSFWMAMIHGVTYVPVWFDEKDHGHGSVWDQITPSAVCWKWKTHWEKFYNPEVNEGECNHQFFNFTGIVAGIAFIVFTVSSLNYIRRRWYRIFYIFHIGGAIALMFAIVWHWAPAVIFLMPSLSVYLASTTPTLIHAMMNYYRGGNQVVSAKVLEDAGGCCEIVVGITPDAAKTLHTETNQFVKLCAPKISMVWHPFTVIGHPHDPKTFRMIIRPIGGFTKELVESLTGTREKPPPRLLVDAFYRGDHMPTRANYNHDHLTIICGGITITPFLTLIPVLLRNLKQAAKDGSLKSKKVVLHWACREPGLLRHIRREYLDHTLLQAQAIVDEDPSFSYHIKIYQTSKGSADNESDPNATASFDNEETSGSEDMKDVNDHDPSSSSDSVKEVMETGSDSSSGALPVDNGRLMPGRYTKIYQNIPAFMVITVLSWLFFYITWRFYNVRASGYPGYKESPAKNNQSATNFWGYVVLLVVQIPAGFVVEYLFVLYDKFFGPNRSTKSYDDVPLDEDLPAVVSNTEQVSVELLQGRPQVDELFESCRQSGVNEPGIFLCAPVPLMQAVIKEARKENKSYLLQTRYTIYEEPFEF